jgi:recombination protein RecT
MAKEKDQLATIKTALESRAEIMKGLLPAHMRNDVMVNRMNRLALTGIMRSPKLFECTPVSIVKGVMDAAALGLDCSGLLGSAYLVPYRNKKTGKYEAQLIPGYRGFIDLAYRRGKVKGINAAVVYGGDDFQFQFGLNPRLDHIPSLAIPRSDDNIIAAYAAWTKGSRYSRSYRVAIWIRLEPDRKQRTMDRGSRTTLRCVKRRP